MYKFFISPSQIMDDEIFITGDDLNHMKNVLRLKPGKEVYASDGVDTDWLCLINRYEDDSAVLDILEVIDDTNELSVEIHLFQGLPKKDKLEWIIQKSVELGVATITPLSMARSIVKIEGKSKDKKVQRWQNIADAAAKQSKRSRLPQVKEPVSIKNALDTLEEMDMILVPYENADGMKYTRDVLSHAVNCGKIGIVIGPEGGFDDDEIKLLQSLDGKIITLGKRILRTETAGLALMSWLMLELEE